MSILRDGRDTQLCSQKEKRNDNDKSLQPLRRCYWSIPCSGRRRVSSLGEPATGVVQRYGRLWGRLAGVLAAVLGGSAMLVMRLCLYCVLFGPSPGFFAGGHRHCCTPHRRAWEGGVGGAAIAAISTWAMLYHNYGCRVSDTGSCLRGWPRLGKQARRLATAGAIPQQ